MEDNISHDQMENKLWQAAAAGDCGTIRTLVMHGVDVDARNEDGFTAFNIATQNGQSDAAMTILAAREMQYAQKIGVDPAEFLDTGEKKTG